jgi:seryl-tRNA synthetase
MRDVKQLLENRIATEAELKERDPAITLDAIALLYEARKTIQTTYDTKRAELKQLSLTAQADPQVRDTARALRAESQAIASQLEEATSKLNEALLHLPNTLQPDVPRSQHKDDKVIVHVFGKPPQLHQGAQDHIELGKRHSILDFERASKIAGSGFPLYRGAGAKLEWGLINFMIDRAIANGFEFMMLPLLNNSTSLTASGNLPRFAEELYSTADGWHAIPTAEVPLTNFYRDETLDTKSLPIRIASYSPCFRREAGGHGKLARGLMRMHQFNKVETYSFCEPQQARREHEELVRNGESILESLGLHYRLANLPSSDLASQSSQTFDIEVWLPKAAMYSEVSSASNCTDFQARRANIKMKGGRKSGYVHTLNCSALATPRVMIALLETYQRPDGSIDVPQVLQPYVGIDRIE